MASFKSSISLIVLISLLHFEFSSAVKGGYWSPDNGMEASDIDSTLFTHLFCAFANFDKQTNQITVPSGCDTFPQAIRGKNSAVKAILSIGGGTVPSTDFNTMASQPSSRKAFIDSSISLAISNGYDGLDLDWEQQTQPDEMNNMATLLNEWRAAINSNGQSLILTAALHYSPIVSQAVTFPAQAISDNLDWVNVMAYDFWAPGWPGPDPILARPHASLNDPTSGNPSGSSGISAWINAGVPANKLVLGVPYYGHAWKLADANNNGILAPVVATNGQDVSFDPFGNEETPTYKQIKSLIPQNTYDDTYVTNYFSSGTTWVAYDDTDSISRKVDYAKTTGLLGYFAWRIDQDQDNWALSTLASQRWGA
ncbi:hypothetical protein SOVF_187520 [Spinacia oleracea]|nr:hypothetical protein SOVF_187520 [Spinacia oleracea]